MHRERTKRIYVGDVPIGANAPVSIQSMTNTVTVDVQATTKQIRSLEIAGCDLVRVSIPDQDSLAAFVKIKEQVNIPVIADIHFDHRIAIGAMEAGADGIRINPGNIGSKQKVAQIAQVAIERKIPIRVGVNLGSIKKGLLEQFAPDRVAALVESARQHVTLLEDLGVGAIKVSLKSSDVIETIETYRRFASICAWPLHLGVTEAGTLFSGAIRSAVGIGVLLFEGIGDTLRVSLSDDPVKEVFAGRVLLESLGLRSEGVHVIACPMCARANADISTIALELEDALSHIKEHLIVAVMGCAVNGPGEARQADMGVACDKNGAVLFVHGKAMKRIEVSEIVSTILEQIQKETSR